MKIRLFTAMAMTTVLLMVCGGGTARTEVSPETAAPETTELYVFAAASMTETMDQIKEKYEAANPGIVIVPTYDSSGTLLKQIQEGADCDLFVSAAPKQMNALEEAGSLVEGSRIDLLENKVTLAVPEGNPKGIESFDQLAELLKSGGVFLCMGNSDVPVGQYTQKIFAFYDLKEEELAKTGVLTYGSNVKEVTTQVKENSVDCGIIYATDAFSAGLETVDSATTGDGGQCDDGNVRTGDLSRSCPERQQKRGSGAGVPRLPDRKRGFGDLQERRIHAPRQIMLSVMNCLKKG